MLVPTSVQVSMKTPQKMPDGSWRKPTISKTRVFNGSLDARYLALLAYWGGRNEAYARGYFKDCEISQYDFRSLYIIAGIMQPLSNEDTVYEPLVLDDVASHEGFCEVDFKFQLNVNKPCLPVMEDYYRKLTFPLEGTSRCTLAELRLALSLGAEISRFRGFGFKPTSNEVDNPLRDFLIEMLKHKTELENANLKGSADYAIEKGKMVGLIGRFAYMKPAVTADSITRMIKFSGLTNPEFSKYGRKKAMRSLYTRAEVGSSWWIEGATLILGLVRSYADWAVNQGSCLLLSTDGGMWLGNPRLDESELSRELAKFHSGIRREDAKTPIDELWIARNRCYSAWSKGVLVHAAQGGTAMSGAEALGGKEVEFGSLIRKCLEAGASVQNEQEVKVLTGLNQFKFDNIPLCSTIMVKKKWTWNYDNKRILDSDVDLWHANTWTRPYMNVMDAFLAAYPHGKPGRRKGSRKLDADAVRALLSEPKTLTHKEVAAKYGISETSVKKLRSGEAKAGK